MSRYCYSICPFEQVIVLANGRTLENCYQFCDGCGEQNWSNRQVAQMVTAFERHPHVKMISTTRAHVGGFKGTWDGQGQVAKSFVNNKLNVVAEGVEGVFRMCRDGMPRIISYPMSMARPTGHIDGREHYFLVNFTARSTCLKHKPLLDNRDDDTWLREKHYVLCNYMAEDKACKMATGINSVYNMIAMKVSDCYGKNPCTVCRLTYILAYVLTCRMNKM